MTVTDAQWHKIILFIMLAHKTMTNKAWILKGMQNSHLREWQSEWVRERERERERERRLKRER